MNIQDCFDLWYNENKKFESTLAQIATIASKLDEDLDILKDLTEEASLQSEQAMNYLNLVEDRLNAMLKREDGNHRMVCKSFNVNGWIVLFRYDYESKEIVFRDKISPKDIDTIDIPDDDK